MKKRKSLLALTALTCALHGASQPIVVHYDPVWIAGLKFDFTSDGTSGDTDAWGDREMVHLEADGIVLALLPNGDPQKVELTVKAIQFRDDHYGSKIMMPAKGSKIVTELVKGGKNLIVIDGHPASDPAYDLLNQVVWINDREHTDTEKFGPDKPVAIGATWPVNSSTLVDKVDGVTLEPISAGGSLTFKSVQGTGENEVGEVTGNYTTVVGVTYPNSTKSNAQIDTSITDLTLIFPTHGRGTYQQSFTSKTVIEYPGSTTQHTNHLTFNNSTTITVPPAADNSNAGKGKPSATTAALARLTSTDPRLDLKTLITEMVRLFQTKDYAQLWLKYMPASELVSMEKLLEPGLNPEQAAQNFPKAIKMLAMDEEFDAQISLEGDVFESLQEQTPTFDATGNIATYKLRATYERVNYVIFKRTNGIWCFDSFQP